MYGKNKIRRVLSAETNVLVMTTVTYLLVLLLLKWFTADDVVLYVSHGWADEVFGMILYYLILFGIYNFYKWVYGKYTVTYDAPPQNHD